MSKTWKRRSDAPWHPLSSASLQRGSKATWSLCMGCHFTTFSRRPKPSRSISSSWAPTAVPDSTMCSWEASRKKSCGSRHARCWWCVNLPSCQCRKGGIVMAFTHVLVPTDFSESANHAVRYALEEATLHHAQVTLLHVLPPHTGTEVYFIAGAPRAEVGFDPVLEGRLGAAIPPRPTVVLQD